jgi:hypothetical protein
MGRSLEEIDIIFRESPSALGTVRYAKRRPHILINEQGYTKPSSEHDEGVRECKEDV